MATSTFKKEFKLTKQGAETIQKLLEVKQPVVKKNKEIKSVKMSKKRFKNIIDHLELEK